MVEKTPITPEEQQKAPIKRTWRDPKLSFAAFLVVSCLAAGGLVLTGYLLYLNNSEYRLDLTRPGLNEISQEELVEVDRTQTYDSTSPVDIEALQEEADSITTRLQDLKRYGDFNDTELDNLRRDLLN